MDFNTKIEIVTSISHQALEHLAVEGDTFNPMLHLWTGEESSLILLDQAPRHFDDAYEFGKLLRGRVAPKCDTVFFISDTYCLAIEEKDEDNETQRRYEQGVPLQRLYSEGAPGVFEALTVHGASRMGDTAFRQFRYLRGAEGAIVWVEGDHAEEATYGGATTDFVTGLLGLDRDGKV